MWINEVIRDATTNSIWLQEFFDPDLAFWNINKDQYNMERRIEIYQNLKQLQGDFYGREFLT